MAVSEIPLSPENQRFSISVAGQSLQMAVTCVLLSGVWISWTVPGPT